MGKPKHADEVRSGLPIKALQCLVLVLAAGNQLHQDWPWLVSLVQRH